MGLDDLFEEEVILQTGKQPEDITLNEQGWRILLSMEVDSPGISADVFRNADKDSIKALINLLDDELNSVHPFGYGEVPQHFEDAREQLVALLEETDEKWG